MTVSTTGATNRTPDSAAPPLVRVREVSKFFGRNAVLVGVNLELRQGEFVGLMGPNGAGKSTLIKILDGIHTADAGVVELDGAAVRSLAGDGRIAFIHQDLGVVAELSINENMWLGATPAGQRRVFVSPARERALTLEALSWAGLHVDPDVRLGTLSSGEQTLVAVARAMQRGARTIVMDEATSTLPPSEARRVLDSLRVATRRGCCVVMVSHKLGEILDFCDRVVVLIDGKVSVDSRVAGLDRAGLVRMLAMEQHADVPDHKREVTQSLVRLDAVAYGPTRDLTLEVRKGEIVGITGMPGTGLHDIGYLAMGLRKPERGSVVRDPRVRTAFMPPHRETQGGFGPMPVLHNLTISSLRTWRRSATRTLSLSDERAAGTAMASRLQVRPPSVDVPYGVLSGGNKQKVIMGRLLLTHPDLLVLCEPTRGVDVRTRLEIYELMRGAAAGGAGVLVLTSDAEDILSVCDRVSAVRASGLTEFTPVSALGLEDLEKLL